MDKRTFLKTLAVAGVSSDVWALSPSTLASQADFWDTLRAHYILTPDFINLENGYYCITPKPTLDRYFEHLTSVNRLGSWYMRNRRFTDNEAVRKELAKVVGCSLEEIIITRNTTESLDTIISAFDWKPGDEAVAAHQDYPSMLHHFELMEKRYGMKTKRVDIPQQPQNDEEIVSLYEKAITPRTKLLLVSHLINITGQVLPIQKIADMAHRKGVPILVDGAHAVAHLDFKLRDLSVDFYGASLHKWLSSPLGAGMLYVKKERIPGLWPMFGDSDYPDHDIRKLNHTGTPAVATDLTILDAISFHQAIGSARKEARLKYLYAYWKTKLQEVPRIHIQSPLDPARSSGIGNVGIEGMSPAKLAQRLLEEFKIWTVAIEGAGVKGCRITPNVFTTTQELDTFVNAMKKIAASA